MSLKVMPAPKLKIEINIFKDAQFWFSKGYSIQLKQSLSTTPEDDKQNNSDAVALDYYLSGVKIDPAHIGCIYNVGCCQYFIRRYANAEKWFTFAVKIDPSHQESYLGLTMASLKLGKYEQALETIEKLNAMLPEWTAEEYKQEQCLFLNAVSARLLDKWDLMKQIYKEM